MLVAVLRICIELTLLCIVVFDDEAYLTSGYIYSVCSLPMTNGIAGQLNQMRSLAILLPNIGRKCALFELMLVSGAFALLCFIVDMKNGV